MRLQITLFKEKPINKTKQNKMGCSYRAENKGKLEALEIQLEVELVS